MQVDINGSLQNIRVTSVILEPGSDPSMLDMYHCWKCGNNVIQFSGTVVAILPGATIAKLPIIAFCSKCKNRYLFNSVM